MTLKIDKKSPWYDERFQPHAGPTTLDNFAPLGLTGSLALRNFIEKETHASISDNRSSETLGKGVYLRKLHDGSYELLIYRGRSCYDGYYSEDRDELVRIAEQKMEERNGNHNGVR